MRRFDGREPPYRLADKREGRVLAGVIALAFGAAVAFFAMLEALTSFSAPVLLFLAIGGTLCAAGAYLVLFVSVMVVDPERREVSLEKASALFSLRDAVPFRAIREVGLREAHYADRYDGGIHYAVELRGRGNIAVPGSKTGDEREAAALAEELAGVIGVRFNREPRKAFTGQWMLGARREREGLR